MSSRLLEIHGTYKGDLRRFENAGDLDTVIGSFEIDDPRQGEGNETESDKSGKIRDVNDLLAEAGSRESGYIKIKGPANEGDLMTLQRYSLFGRWRKYRGEDQFHFTTFIQQEPAGRPAIVNYLVKAGQRNHIGHARANRIFDKFGEDSVRIAREEPETVSKLTGVRLELCESMSRWLNERKQLEQTTLRLNALLHGRGFPKSLPTKLINIYGNAAEHKIRKDPYSLMSFTGCGFQLCDKMFLDLGGRPDRLRRQALAGWYGCASNKDGHTWFPVNQVVKEIINRCGPGSNPKKALQLARKIGQLREDRHGALAIGRTDGNGCVVKAGGEVWVAEGRKANKEILLAELISEAIIEDCHWPEVDSIENIDDHQREGLESALRGPVSILGGGPGTGKTFTAANLIRVLAGKFGMESIAVAAPTGKAASRVSEVMSGYGIDLAARTWHSLLGVGEINQVSGNWSFRHKQSSPWPYKVIIGDESSMLDTDLMSNILAARAAGTHLLFIGDINQLPPVGHGAPLRDLIAAGLPYGELTEIKRNSGGIVEACSAIRQGKKWNAGDNLIVRDRPDQVKEINATIREAEAAGFDPIWDCQVIVAVNEKSSLSRKELNKVLAEELNGASRPGGGSFAVGDKIVCLKNGFYKWLDSIGSGEESDEHETNDDGEVFVANGELAEVVEVEDKFYTAKVLSPERLVRIPRGKSDEKSSGCNFDLGFALSCHKSQGSEWPVVVVAIDSYAGARRICDRSWAYTAISRAKSTCYLVGKKSVADGFCRKVSITKRKTFLRELIQLKNAERELVEL